METTKHGLCIKSKKFTIDNIINLFNQNPEIIKILPHWLIEIHLKSEFGDDSTLKEFALNNIEKLKEIKEAEEKYYRSWEDN